MAFRMLETQNCFICVVKCNFEIFFKEKLLIWTKFMLKSEQNIPNITCSHKIETSIGPRKNTIFKKSFEFRTLLWTSFSVISLTFLYDEYIDRPKLSEQKKPIWVYSPSPPQVGWEQLREGSGRMAAKEVGKWVRMAEKGMLLERA